MLIMSVSQKRDKFNVSLEDQADHAQSPSSNTGVLITSSFFDDQGKLLEDVQKELEATRLISQKVDWLAFTLPADLVKSALSVVNPKFNPCVIDTVLELVGLPCDDFVDTGHGGLGYQHAVDLDGLPGAKLYFGGQRGTVFVSLSASALAFYVDVRGLDWRGWLRYLVDLGVRFRRFDHATDDKVGFLTYERIKAAIRQWSKRKQLEGDELERFEGETIVTRFRNIPLLYGDKELGGDGYTFYWGVARTKTGGRRNNSDSIVRIYNKAAEQGVEGHWVRVEAQYRSDKADQVVREWVKTDFSPEYLTGVLRGVIDFRVAQVNDTNQSRWVVADWWGEFLSFAERVVVTVKAKITRTVRERADWVRRQISTTLAMIVDTLGKDTIDEIVDTGRERLTTMHKAIMEAEPALMPT